HIYASGGQYTGSLVVTSDLGCKDSVAQNIVVHAKPLAAFNVDAACLGDSTQFINQSIVAAGSVVNGWNWNFGDAIGTSTMERPKYEYANAGFFNARLIAETNFGCLDTVVHTVEVVNKPVSSFTFSNACVNEVVDFQNTFVPQGGLTPTFNWDFGNTDFSTSTNPVGYVYAVPGIYDVVLTTTVQGCSDTALNRVEVFPLPVANFEFDSVCFPFETSFKDLSSGGNGYSINSWNWRFGDNVGTANVQNPIYEYQKWGAYMVELVVVSSSGCADTTTLGPVKVYPKPLANFSDRLGSCLGKSPDFQDLSSVENAPNDNLTWRSWDFSDGASSSQDKPAHIFQTSGTYDVKLFVGTNHGCLDTVTNSVEIYPLPEVNFEVNTNTACEPFDFEFKDLSEIALPATIKKWEWDFGDGSIGATTQHPTHIYEAGITNNAGIATYSVSLQITSNKGCVADTVYSNFIKLYQKPEADFSVSPYETELIEPDFQITDGSSSNVVSWLYDWGDGSVSLDQNPSHTYSDSGYYNVVQYVTTRFGCEDTAQFVVRVRPEFRFYIPSAFTPNNDKDNDEFFGKGLGIETYVMRIYNRWGELIFTSNDYDVHWDGTMNGRDVQQGVYVYSFDIIDVNGQPHIYSGGVTLVR
ncbi:PKD domain-containing protein, partial [Bacteroidota bacterium]